MNTKNIVNSFYSISRAEKEWGDGMRGLSMSAARYALLRLEESQPHVKNWRPQILILVNSEIGVDSENIKIKHPNLFALASQLKAGKGLTVSASVITGDCIEKLPTAKKAKQILKESMENYRVKGFCETLVSQNVEQGLSHLLQTEGLGGLRHNTIIMNWPQKFDDEEKCLFTYQNFVNSLRYAKANESAIIITKGIDSWPIDKKSQYQSETIDIWWIIHDGGLLLLIVFLLKKRKMWRRCKLRLFTVAYMHENSTQIKNDLMQYIYHLRIQAEVDVIEMPDSDISAYNHERTLIAEDRDNLYQKASEISSEAVSTIDNVRRASLIQTPRQLNKNESMIPLLSENDNSNFTSPVASTSGSSLKKFKNSYKSETIRKMHTAIQLNKTILQKSNKASLVLLNIPTPPKTQSSLDDYSYMEYINVLAEGLSRVLLVHGTGREVITIFS
jgi:hypothetical protein